MMTEYPKPNDNTYKEIWRALSCLAASYPPETLFVTEDGKIGIEVDGVVTTLSAREWFAAGNSRKDFEAAIRLMNKEKRDD
jgi:hypothetical protein